MNFFHCTSIRWLFLLFGLWKNYDPDNGSGHPDDCILEGEGARVAHRNNLALASIVVASGLAGTGPQDLEVLGTKTREPQAAIVVCLMLVIYHGYWYFMRFQHLLDDAKILVFSVTLNHCLCGKSRRDNFDRNQQR
ncbi:MAG: hypothetical protein OXC63_09260 [Aestuariivita sp.]|nr:hypothetical protein [Aestuariivita sp.]